MNEIRLSENPREDIPEVLYQSIVRFILLADPLEASARVGALFDAWNSWLGDESMDAALAVISEHERDDNTSPRLVTLMNELMVEEEDADVVTRRWAALSDIIGEFDDLIGDQEKLVGHLLLVHRVPPSDLLSQSQDELLVTHSQLHGGRNDRR